MGSAATTIVAWGLLLRTNANSRQIGLPGIASSPMTESDGKGNMVLLHPSGVCVDG